MKKSILILLDNPFFSENPDPRVKRTSLYFLKKGFKVSVVCLKCENLPNNEVLDGIEIHRIFSSDIMRPKSMLMMRRKMAKTIYNLIDFDFIFSNDHTMLDLAVRIKKMSPKKILIHDSHEFFPSYRMVFNKGESFFIKIKSKLWRLYENFLEKKNAKIADYWVTVDISLAAIFNRIYKLKNRAIYIRNIPDFKKTEDSLEEYDHNLYQALEQIKYGNNLIYIGYYIQNGSGIEAVFDSLKKLSDDTNLILLGSNWSVDYFNDLVQKKNIANRVLFINPIPANYVPIVASYAKIGITPTIDDNTLSTFFSLPNKVFDYIKSEIPIIATDLPEHVNILENFKNGITIHGNNSQKAEQIAIAFNKIMDNYKDYKEKALKCSIYLNTEDEYIKMDKIFHELN